MSGEDPRGKVLVVGEEALVLMYKTLNCMGVEVSNPQELLDAVEKYSRRNDIAIILVQQDLAEPVKEEIDRVIGRTGKIISFVPSPHTPGEPVDMRSMLMKALGFG